MASSDLASYQLQLQQVEAALSADPENSELLTLKADLEQVIELTKELVSTDVGDSTQESDTGNYNSELANEDLQHYDDSKPQEENKEAKANKRKYEYDQTEDARQPIKHWQVGEECQALSHKDGQYYDAVIEEITTDGEVSVKFKKYNNTTVTTLVLLKASSFGTSGPSSAKNKKEELAKQREYLKKKKAKKAERFKKMDEQREEEKSKWQNFSSKAFGKRGFVKKSIFKTPENAQGRVGIGTCGVSGQKMTTFSSANKYRRGT